LPQPKFRFATGIPALDAASRGGFPTGTVVVFSGWPDAGKTGLGTQIVTDIALHYEVVAVLFTPDGGQESTAIRIGGLLGLDQDKLEARDPEEKAKLEEKLRDRRIFIIDDSLEGMALDRIVSDAEKFRPDLPHVYFLDSAQECLATEKADELDERHRVIALVRAVYSTVKANPIPSLAIVTSQVSGQAFAPGKRSDRTNPLGAPAESKKISYLSHLMVSLEGDPSQEPEFGRAKVVKSKLRGTKPSFRLQVDPKTSRLSEVDPATITRAKEEARAKAQEARLSAITDRICARLQKSGPLLTGEIQDRVIGDKGDIKKTLDALEAQGRVEWEPTGQTGRGRRWRLVAHEGREGVSCEKDKINVKGKEAGVKGKEAETTPFGGGSAPSYSGGENVRLSQEIGQFNRPKGAESAPLSAASAVSAPLSETGERPGLGEPKAATISLQPVNPLRRGKAEVPLSFAQEIDLAFGDLGAVSRPEAVALPGGEADASPSFADSAVSLSGNGNGHDGPSRKDWLGPFRGKLACMREWADTAPNPPDSGREAL
jgi:hypothetical protein